MVTPGKAPKAGEDRHILSILTEGQRERGYLSGDFLEEVARRENLPLSRVYEVATFYSFLSTRPRGRNVIRVCKCAPCQFYGGESLLGALERELGIEVGQSTPDGRFSLELTNCVGACDEAPALMINDRTYTRLTPETIREALGRCG